MNVTLSPSVLSGRVMAPPSKSHVHRLLLAAALCGAPAETHVRCPGGNADIDATVRCLSALHTDIKREGDLITVQRSAPLRALPPKSPLDCGESGSTLRFLLPLCAYLGGVTMTGEGRLPSRPNGPLLDALRAHGAAIHGDFLPLRVEGTLRPGAYALPGNVSSQYFSGLLFALPLLPGDSLLTYTSPLESMPYVDLTLSVLRQFGIRIEHIENGWRVPGGQAYLSPGDVEAEGDWSAAAFWLSANALGSDVQVTGLNNRSCQGDQAIQRLLSQVGGVIDVSDTPDLMPVLSVVAAAAPGRESRITGAARLRLKESDRIAAMKDAVLSLGGWAEETPDGLILRGRQLRGGTVDGKGDHRVVMSAAVAATVCQGPVTILGAEAVDKSYPAFWQDYKALGGCVYG